MGDATRASGDQPAPRVGFAVLYRWRLRQGLEPAFQEAWARVTEAYLEQRGALGSRLHRSDDGLWVAYAQWPNRAAWERAQQASAVDVEAAQRMAEAIEESLEPILLHPCADYLLPRSPR